MSVLNVLQAGKSGMNSAKAGIATSGHNISNANTEGFSRQRVQTTAEVSEQMAGRGGPYIGQGSKMTSINRVNDQYLEKQLREGGKDLAHFEEKQIFLGQVEDVFNEMNGDGLNRIVARFFNDFRKLSNEPGSEAIRQSLRESSQAMVNDFKRVRTELIQIRDHVDSRLDGSVQELNQMAEQLKELNIRIQQAEIQKQNANDLQDQRDLLVSKMNSYLDLASHKDNQGMITLDVKGVGPLVTGPNVEKYFTGRAPEQQMGEQGVSPENSLQISRSPWSPNYITTQFRGGKIGALVELRDQTIGKSIDRLDELASAITQSVNEIHAKGFTQEGRSRVEFFKPLHLKSGAAEQISLSDDVLNSTSNIAAGLVPNAPGDNRIALAISNLQNARFMNNGQTSVDDFYNSIVSEVGVSAGRNAEALTQQKGINTQLQKLRDSVSGVSIDEEVTNLMQYQHAFDASARVIKVADEMLDTILNLKR